MGSTILTDCRVGAFPRPDRSIWYVLFEETYESNVVPHMPSWEARTIGRYEEVLTCVYCDAANAEAGLLKSRRGSTSPEAVLRRWREAFQHPIALADQSIELRVAPRWDAPIPAERAEAVLTQLESLGHGELADRLRAGPVTMSLHADADVLSALYRPGAGLGLWRALSARARTGPVVEALAPSPRRGSWVMPPVQAYSADRNHVVVSVGAAPYRYTQRYCAVVQFLEVWARDLELQATGAGAKALGLFRERLAQAPALPPETRITLTGEGDPRVFGRQAPRTVLATLGADAPPGIVAGPYSFRLGTRMHEVLESLRLFGALDVAWSVPVQDSPAPGRVDDSRSCTGTQLMLL